MARGDDDTWCPRISLHPRYVRIYVIILPQNEGHFGGLQVVPWIRTEIPEIRWFRGNFGVSRVDGG